METMNLRTISLSIGEIRIRRGLSPPTNHFLSSCELCRTQRTYSIQLNLEKIPVELYAKWLATGKSTRTTDYGEEISYKPHNILICETCAFDIERDYKK